MAQLKLVSLRGDVLASDALPLVGHEHYASSDYLLAASFSSAAALAPPPPPPDGAAVAAAAASTAAVAPAGRAGGGGGLKRWWADGDEPRFYVVSPKVCPSLSFIVDAMPCCP